MKLFVGLGDTVSDSEYEDSGAEEEKVPEQKGVWHKYCDFVLYYLLL